MNLFNFISDPEPFEWYYGFEHFRDLINDVLNHNYDASVLIAGCGTSEFMEEMVKNGYNKILGVDISRVAIETMTARCAKYPQISFHKGNMTDTDLPEHIYDVIIDKACFDSMLCSGTGVLNIKQYMQEIDRLLSDNGGIYILISHANPEQRLPFIEQYDTDLPGFTPWDVEVLSIRKYL